MSRLCVTRRNRCGSSRRPRGGRRAAVRRAALFAMIAVGLPIGAARAADDRFLVQGLADLEAWDTGSRSLYLSRNQGDAANQERLRLWAAAQFTPRLQVLL